VRRIRLGGSATVPSNWKLKIPVDADQLEAARLILFTFEPVAKNLGPIAPTVLGRVVSVSSHIAPQELEHCISVESKKYPSGPKVSGGSDNAR